MNKDDKTMTTLTVCHTTAVFYRDDDDRAEISTAVTLTPPYS